MQEFFCTTLYSHETSRLISAGFPGQVDSAAAAPDQVALVGETETGEILQQRTPVFFVFVFFVEQSEGAVASEDSDEGEEPLGLGRGQRRGGGGRPELDGQEDHRLGGGGQGQDGREAARDEGACKTEIQGDRDPSPRFLYSVDISFGCSPSLLGQ